MGEIVGRYVLRRLLIYIPVLLLITIIVFGLSLLAPGDPVDWLNNPEQPMSAAQLQAAREAMGLDKPAPVRYALWLGNVVRGNFGYRLKNGDAIGPLVLQRLERTLILSGLASLIGIVIGLSLGIYTAWHQYSIIDYLATTAALIGISSPAFFVAILALWFFALDLRWFPVGGLTTVGTSPSNVPNFLQHLILPALVLSTNQIAGYFRYMRMSMLEVIHADYLTTARAKGLRSRTVILTHALRNALLPVVTFIGMNVPLLLGGALFTETIFAWPGMGLLFYDGVTSRDYPLIMAMTLVLAAIILLANLLTDVTYSLIDPRIRLDG